MEMEMVARAKGSPRMLLDRNRAILEGVEYGDGLWREDDWVEEVTM